MTKAGWYLTSFRASSRLLKIRAMQRQNPCFDLSSPPSYDTYSINEFKIMGEKKSTILKKNIELHNNVPDKNTELLK